MLVEIVFDREKDRGSEEEAERGLWEYLCGEVLVLKGVSATQVAERLKESGFAEGQGETLVLVLVLILIYTLW